MNYDDGVEEMITNISDLDNEHNFTVARVMENGECVELHYNEGKAIIEYAIKVADDLWINQDEVEVEWFSLNLTEDEILSRLNNMFDEYFK